MHLVAETVVVGSLDSAESGPIAAAVDGSAVVDYTIAGANCVTAEAAAETGIGAAVVAAIAVEVESEAVGVSLVTGVSVESEVVDPSCALVVAIEFDRAVGWDDSS